MKPICSFRNLASSLSLRFVVSISFINKVLSLLFDCTSKVPRICNNVVLPAPDAPTIETISPFSIWRSTPFKTSNSP